MTVLHHDVVVVGDGPVGLAHAAAHAAAGRTVALVGPERRHPPNTYELLSGDLAPVLQVIGILPAIRQHAPRCEGTVFRWGRDAFTEQTGRTDRWAGGWIIDRAWFDQALRDVVAATFPQITFVAGIATTVRRTADCWSAEIAAPGRAAPARAAPARAGPDRSGPDRSTRGSTGTAVVGRSLSLATGRSDRLHRSAGLRPVRRHPMVAITCRIPDGLPDLRARLMVDAAADGWWYVMGDGHSSTMGYVTDSDLLAPGPDRIRATWARVLSATPWAPDELVDAPVIVRRSVVGECPPSTDPGAALPVGDCALSADPLSGHGLLVGLRAALHAAADPDSYRQWIGRQLAGHREQEHGLYKHVSRARTAGDDGGTFWNRRGK